MRTEPLTYWLPAVAWALLILTSSGEIGSSGRTESFIATLFAGLSGDLLFLINYLLRKGVHVAAYAVLGMLNLRAVRSGRPGWHSRWGVTALALALAVALLDEGRQAASATRTGSVADIGLDLCGASLGVLAVKVYTRKG